MASAKEKKNEPIGPDLAESAALTQGGAGIRVKRTYDPPESDDGRRILVERLWPRGMTKEALSADAWMKEVAPSTVLRTWFGHRPERWEEFRRRYRKELDANPTAWAPILEAGRHGPVTLLYSARDTLHNGALVLRDYLVGREAENPDQAGDPAEPAYVEGDGPARARAMRDRMVAVSVPVASSRAR